LLLEGRSTCAALGGHRILPMHRNCSRLWLELLELFHYKYIYEFCQSDGGLNFLSVFVFIKFIPVSILSCLPRLLRTTSANSQI